MGSEGGMLVEGVDWIELDWIMGARVWIEGRLRAE